MWKRSQTSGAGGNENRSRRRLMAQRTLRARSVGLGRFASTGFAAASVTDVAAFVEIHDIFRDVLGVVADAFEAPSHDII